MIHPHRRRATRLLAASLATATASVALVAGGATVAHAATVADDALTQAADPSGVVAIAVLENDLDAVAVAAVTQPAVGSVAIVGSTLELTYPSTFYGDAVFAYTATDAEGGTADATVRVTITNAAPVLGDDEAVTATEPIAIDVLANDADPNGDALAITATSVAPEQGRVVVDDAGTADPSDDVVVFSPATTFVGLASVTYEVTDARGTTATAVVAVTVGGPDPVLEYDVVRTPIGVPVVVDALGNDVDPLGRTLSYDSFGVDELTYGRLDLDDGGTPADAADDVLVFTPAPGFVGVLGFRYVAATPQGGRFVGFGAIEVYSPSPTMRDDHVSTPYGTAVTVDALANDEDPSGGTPSIVSVQADDAQGTAEIVDGQVRFTPSEGFVGRALMTYHIVTAGGQPGAAVIAVTVEQGPTAGGNDGAGPGDASSLLPSRLPETGTPALGAIGIAVATLLTVLGAWLLGRRRLG
ncbi:MULTISPECIES: Ig-like domain-containing protein [unclassified Agrococcus]|uniref:Ig-like domain-containing protein n=1 Tax=unclassified Agrococcus TaxID=2615065 RepID=UPI003618AD80